MLITLASAAGVMACSQGEKKSSDFKYLIDEFADIKIMRYQIPGWDNLSFKQKEYLYHLSEAAKFGWDIYWDQNCKDNLAVRKVLQNILENYKGDRNCKDFQDFTVYAKRVFFSSGIHHHYAEDKFFPECGEEYFKSLMVAVGESEKCATLLPVIYSKELYAQRRSSSKTGDIVALSSVNFYEGVTRDEVEKYYAGITDKNDPEPISYGLNTKVIKGPDGKIREEAWKVGGIYGPALEKICEELEKAKAVAENDVQKKTISELQDYYRTGDLRLWDKYNITWVKDTISKIDFTNGFVEDYNDPLGRKAYWESVVNVKDSAASARTELLSANAQWFEDNAPIDPRFKKKSVKGVSAKVIDVTCLGGGCYPATPIGINLPNADWIRKEYGSKSVTIANITHAYDAKNSHTQKRISQCRRSMEHSTMRFTPIFTSASDMVQDSFFQAFPLMPWENMHLHSKKPEQTSSVSIISLTLSLWNLVSSKILKHINLTIPTIYVMVSWFRPTAWNLDARLLRHICRTVSLSLHGAMSMVRQTTLSRRKYVTARHIS